MNYQTFQNPNNPFGAAPQLPATMPGTNYASPGSMQGAEAYARLAPGINAQLAYDEGTLGNRFSRELQQNQQQSVLAGLADLAQSKKQDQALEDRALGNQLSFMNSALSPLFNFGRPSGGGLMNMPSLTGKPF